MSSNGGSVTKKRIRQKSTANAGGRIKIPACDSCHTRKIKCQRERPCLNCIRYGVTCLDSTNVIGIIGNGTSPQEVEALKARVAQLESLLRERTNSTGSFQTNSSGDFAINPLSGYSADEDGVTDITACMKRAGLVTSFDDNSTDAGSDHARRDLLFSDISISFDGELPDIIFPPKCVAEDAMYRFKTGVFLFNRLSNVKGLEVTFDRVYGCVGADDRPPVHATPETLVLYMALITALTTDTPLSSALYKAAKPILRLMWSHLSVENLTIIMMEVIFLGFTGRLDEAWLALGVACRSAQAMGLHREDGSLMVQWDENTRDLAKSLWWEIYMHDRWYSLCFGRPLMIRDKDCNVGMPNFSGIERESLPPWQPAAFEYTLLLSRIAGKITKKLSTSCPPSTSSFANVDTEAANPFRMSTEKLGEKLHDELVQFHLNLPAVLKDPTANPAALVIALKYENIRCMLFRRFLTHPTPALRQHAQDQVFASALAITQICEVAKRQLHDVPCGTLTIIILTGAVAVASYLRAHKGEEDPRALEAKRCLEVLATSLGCMRFPKGPSPLAIKNWHLMNRIIAFSESNDKAQNINREHEQNGVRGLHQESSQNQQDGHGERQVSPLSYSYEPSDPASHAAIGSDIGSSPPNMPATHVGSQQPSLLEHLENTDEWRGIMDYDLEEHADLNHYMDPFSEAFMREIESQPHESWFAIKAH